MIVKLDQVGVVGAFSLVEYDLAPGNGPGQHAHEECSETYFILEGELTFRLGRDQRLLTPGSLIHVPPGVVHGFRNETDERVRMLWLFSPGQCLGKMGWDPRHRG